MANNKKKIRLNKKKDMASKKRGTNNNFCYLYSIFIVF